MRASCARSCLLLFFTLLPFTLLSGCLPLFRAVPLGGPTQALPPGPAQGPFTLTVPLDPARPHRVAVHLLSRCTPQVHLELTSTARGTLKQELGDHGSTQSLWQDMLRRRFLASEAASTAPTPRAPPQPQPGPAPGVGVAVTSSGTVSTSVTLPGRWVQETTFDASFEAERARRCAVEGDYFVTFPEVFEAGEKELTVVAWAEVPQLLEGATLSVQVERIDPPEPPKEDHATPPADGATWREGTFTWFNEGEYGFGWKWTAGTWLAPATEPAPRVERTGEPPNLGQVWVTGHWRWAGRAGWDWVGGGWSVPSTPGTPPPPKQETPPTVCATGTWMTGSWSWASDKGWVWRNGRWSVPEQPTLPKPAPREETHGEPPHLGQSWFNGSWQWKGCEGWGWLAGSWDFPADPPGPPPAPKDEWHGVTLCSAAVWETGHWRWTKKGWDWDGGQWRNSASPTSAQPAPKVEAHDAAPNPGQEWAQGSWNWNPCDGWAWAGGSWVVPARPTGTPPPPRQEERGEQVCRAATWHPGAWTWSTRVGWEWRSGEWQNPLEPAEAQPARLPDEAHGQPPNPGQVWADGSWRWGSCAGWEWRVGRWVVPPRPTGNPPPPVQETPPVAQCPAATWQPGSWRWSLEVGWDWAWGEWRTSATPTAARPLDYAERPYPAPAPGLTWSPGRWDWTPCMGWTWYQGIWVKQRPVAVAQAAPVRPAEPDFVPLPMPTPAVTAQPAAPSAQRLSCNEVMTAPPGPRAETPPPTPAEGSVWIPGAWLWSGCDWEWRKGRWHQPPQPGMVWEPGATIELGRWVSGGVVTPVHPATPVPPVHPATPVNPAPGGPVNPRP